MLTFFVPIPCLILSLVACKDRNVIIKAPNKLIEDIIIQPNTKTGQLFNVSYIKNKKVPEGFDGSFTDIGVLVQKLVKSIEKRKPTKSKAVKDNWEKNHGAVPTEQGS